MTEPNFDPRSGKHSRGVGNYGIREHPHFHVDRPLLGIHKRRLIRHWQRKEFRVKRTLDTETAGLNQPLQSGAVVTIQIGKSQKVVIPHGIDQKVFYFVLQSTVSKEKFTYGIEETIRGSNGQQPSRFQDAVTGSEKGFGIVDLFKTIPDEDAVECLIGEVPFLQLDSMDNKPLRSCKSARVFPYVHALGLPAPLACHLQKSSVVATYFEHARPVREQVAVRLLLLPKSSNIVGVLALDGLQVVFIL